MPRAEILTPWVAAADDPSDMPSNHPQIMDHYPLQRMVDVTGQPAENITPTPNLLAIEATCTAEVLDQIEADSRYLVLWSEE